MSDIRASDEDLLLRVEAHDAAALAVLFDRYADLLFRIGLKILHDRSEAEDLVQEVFVGLFEKVRGFDPAKGAGRTWIVQITYRRGFDRRAYLSRRQQYSGTDLQLAQNIQEENCFEDQLVDFVAGERLHARFEELNERQRATLEMYFFEGRELREISERLGETLANTRHYFYRGLERLRKSVADAHPDKKDV